MNDISQSINQTFQQLSIWFETHELSFLWQPFVSSYSWIETHTPAVAGWLWIVFILIGLSLLFTAYYFRRQSKQLNRAIATLYHMNETFKQDALEFFEQAWPVLSSVGCQSLQANVEWFGELKQIQKGRDNRKASVKSYLVQREDMRFEILIAFSRDAEQKDSVAALVVKTFLHILEQNLVLKQSAILTSQKRLERYQLFVQHEIKNIAQFIQMLSEQVEMLDSDQAKIKLVDRLTSTLPVMSQRARKTVDHMQQPLSEFYEGDVFELEELIENVTQMYGLNAEIQGKASVNLSREVLHEIFKNVLGNYRDHSAGLQKILIQLKQDVLSKEVNMLILSKNNTGQAFQAERMFEPFWTTSESGMGLGLFLARELLKQLDGSIELYQDPTKQLFGFQIRFP